MSTFNDKAVFNPIDLSRLPFPPVVQVLDYEVILDEMLTDLRARDPIYTAIVESDPSYKILEVCAYRETVLRQQMNDAAKALMIAYGVSGDLDNLAANYNVERLPGESDSALRVRAQLAFEGLSTAGPVGAYTFHGRSASPLVKDIDVASPSPGLVVITVLSTEGDGTPDQVLLDGVAAALNDEDVRPLTDHVLVQAPTVIEYTVVANLTMYEGPSGEVVRQTAEDRLRAYIEAHHRLGHDITISGLHAAMHVDGGVQEVMISEPTETLVIAHDAVAYNTSVQVVLGGTNE